MNYKHGQCDTRLYHTWENMKKRCYNKNITINGETHCLVEWCEIYNMPYDKVKHRINQCNWSIKRALGLEEK